MRVRGYIKTLGKFIAALIVGGGLVITWEPVQAEPLAPAETEWDASELRWWYDMKDSDEAGSWVVLSITNGIQSAIHARAMEECRKMDGTLEWDCYTARVEAIQEHVTNYMTVAMDGEKVTRQAIANVFWADMQLREMDGAYGMGFGIAVFINGIIGWYEKTS